MNILYRFAQAQLAACIITLALIIIWSQPVWADARQYALFELDRLRQFGAARNVSEELKSAEATFATAEHYFQANELEQSQRFYLLTIQKIRVTLSSLPGSTSTPVAPSTTPAVAETSQRAIPVPVAGPQPSAEEVPDNSLVFHDISIPPIEPETGYSSDDITSGRLVGTASAYSVIKGDTIRLVAAKLGVSRQQLIRKNRLDEKAYLKIGQKLIYNNRKIVPRRMRNGIIVNIPDRTLYYFRQGRLAASLPVALGAPVKSDTYDWETPTGTFRITAKLRNPTWHIPPSIQSEMEGHGKKPLTSVPPGASNPLGKYAIKTSIPGILIHSTTKLWSIYSFASHGCIRVYPKQMETLFRDVAINTPGVIIYKPVKLAITEDGRVFLEVNRDVYGRNSGGLAKEARRLIEKQNLSKRVDWLKVESMMRHTSGIAEDITL